jgi:tRNA-dihydrouridine synthase
VEHDDSQASEILENVLSEVLENYELFLIFRFLKEEKNMADCPTVREFLEVMRRRDRKLSVSFMSEEEYRMLRDIVTAILSKEPFSVAAPSNGVILILQGRGERILDKAIKAVEKMLEVHDALQEIPFKVSVSSVSSTTMESPGVTVRLNLDTLNAHFSIPCQDKFWAGEATPHDELKATLNGLIKTKEKLKEILEEMEKPMSEALTCLYTRGIMDNIIKWIMEARDRLIKLRRRLGNFKTSRC